MKAYATPADLGRWLDPEQVATDAEANAAGNAYVLDHIGDPSAARVLLRATEVVEGYVLAGYDADADGLPTDTDLAAWLRDAACAQVEFWALVSEQHDVAGIGGTLSVEGMTHRLPGKLGPRALRLLDMAGLRKPVGGRVTYYRTPLELIGRV